MATQMVYKWLCPVPSTSGRQHRGAVPVRVPEEMLTYHFVTAPLPSWLTSGERAHLHLHVRPYLHDVILNVRGASQNFTLPLRDYAFRQELATRVCQALLVIDSVQIPLGVPKCLMCDAPVAGRETPAAGENRLRCTESFRPTGRQPWILVEMMVYPCWRVWSPMLRLCAVHSDEFAYALKAVTFGCVRLPQEVLYASAQYDSSSPSDPEAQVGPSS